jgi:hypothetical protein
VSTTPATPSTDPSEQPSVTVIGHSDLFYWWPVWVAGYLMALLTYLGDNYMAIVPADTRAEKAVQVEGVEGKRDALIVPSGRELPVDETGAVEQPRLRISRSNNPGAVFVTVLVLVILVTNIRLTGVWSLVLIMLFLFLSVLFALVGAWDFIFRTLGKSDVHITAAGYLYFATPIFVIWLGVLLFYDRLTYATFTPGQFTIHFAFGAGAKSYEVHGLILEKKQDDLFRHWILGIGSGDLVIRTGGANPQTYELPNVLSVNSKLAKAKQMLQKRQVINK